MEKRIFQLATSCILIYYENVNFFCEIWGSQSVLYSERAEYAPVDFWLTHMETGGKQQGNADKDAECSQLMERSHSVILRMCELFYPKDSYGEKELHQEFFCQLWKGFSQSSKDVPEGENSTY